MFFDASSFGCTRSLALLYSLISAAPTLAVVKKRLLSKKTAVTSSRVSLYRGRVLCDMVVVINTVAGELEKNPLKSRKRLSDIENAGILNIIIKERATLLSGKAPLKSWSIMTADG